MGGGIFRKKVDGRRRRHPKSPQPAHMSSAVMSTSFALDDFAVRAAKVFEYADSGSVNGIIFTTYAGEELVEQWTVTRQAFSDSGDQTINHRLVKDAIVAGTADALFDQVANLHFETFDDEYSQLDWYGQLCRLLDVISP